MNCDEHSFIIVNLKNKATLKNINALCNVELILRFFNILPMFECVYALIKVAQYVHLCCNFVEFVRLP
jgi:hypothetical protein